MLNAQVREIIELLMKRPITEEIIMQVGAYDEFKHLEIVDGEWVGFEHEWDEAMTGEQHGWIQSLILHELMNHILRTKAGRIYPGDTDFILHRGDDGVLLKRKPDVAFVKAENVRPSKGLIQGAPDLAVEIISPSQTRELMTAKAAEFMRYGTQSVWLVFPAEKQIEVHQPEQQPITYGIDDVLIDAILPEFELSISKIFEES